MNDQWLHDKYQQHKERYFQDRVLLPLGTLAWKKLDGGKLGVYEHGMGRLLMKKDALYLDPELKGDPEQAEKILLHEMVHQCVFENRLDEKPTPDHLAHDGDGFKGEATRINELLGIDVEPSGSWPFSNR